MFHDLSDVILEQCLCYNIDGSRKSAQSRGWKTVNLMGNKTFHTLFVFYNIRWSKRTAARRALRTINLKGKNTPSINFGCWDVDTWTESIAAHTSHSMKTLLVKHRLQNQGSLLLSYCCCTCKHLDLQPLLFAIGAQHNEILLMTHEPLSLLTPACGGGTDRCKAWSAAVFSAVGSAYSEASRHLVACMTLPSMCKRFICFASLYCGLWAAWLRCCVYRIQLDWWPCHVAVTGKNAGFLVGYGPVTCHAYPFCRNLTG